MNEPSFFCQPNILIELDYDGYFERLVRNWLDRKEGLYRHSAIHINSGPYRESAVSYESRDGVLLLDFYSALRAGFGGLSEDDVNALIALL
jgi:hypothetical protein